MCPPSSLETLEGHPSADVANTNTRTTIPDFVPEHEVCIAAFRLAQANLPVAILNHSIRVYLYARRLAGEQSPHATKDDPAGKDTLLFVTCILHDIGCAAQFNGPRRFEVEGASAAKAHLLQFNFTPADAHAVWIAIALHTSAHIAEEISTLAYLLRMSVLFDFMETKKSQIGNGSMDVLSQSLRTEVESVFPRLEPEKVLGDAVVAQAMQARGKAPAASWPGIMLRAALEEPEWKGVNKAF